MAGAIGSLLIGCALIKGDDAELGPVLSLEVGVLACLLSVMVVEEEEDLDIFN